jgi:hypothetical protein
MADTAVLRVDVASADFDKFKATFDQYAKTLQDTLATWSKITAEVKAASSAMSNMAAPVAKSTASLQKFTSQFSETAKHTKSIRSDVEGISKGLISWRTAMTSTLALLGLGGGLFGLTSLVQGSVADRARALAMGVNYGQFRGMNVGAFPGAGAAMQGFGTARWDPTSNAYRGANVLFGAQADRQLARTDPLVMVDALDRATRYLGQFDEKLRGTIAAQSGLNDLLGPEALRAWMALDNAEKDARRRAIDAAGKQATQAEASIAKWTTFQIQLTSTASILQDIALTKLAPLSTPLTNLSVAIESAVTQFLDAPAITKIINDLKEGIDSFTAYLNSPEGKKDIDDFAKYVGDTITEVKTLAQGIAAVLNTITDAQNAMAQATQRFYRWLDSWFQPSKAEQDKQIVPGHANPITLKSLRDAITGRSPLDAAADIAIPPELSGGSGKPQQELMAPGLLGNNSWVKGWFTAEQQSTKEAARTAAQRDETTQRLMGNLDDWFGRTGDREDKLDGTLEDLRAYLDKAGAVGNVASAGTGGAFGGAEGVGPGGVGGAAPANLRRRGTGGGDEIDMGGGGGQINVGGQGMTRADRNLNPGNVMWGPWAKAHGATGWSGTDVGHGVAVFPTAQAGTDALQALLRSKMSGGRNTLKAIFDDPGGYNPGRGEASRIAAHWGIGVNDPISPDMFNKLTQETIHQEGAPGLEKAFASGTLASFKGGVGDVGPNSVGDIRGPQGGNAADANALLAEVKKTHPHLSNEQCVTLVKEFCGMGGTVADWRRGQSAMSGNLKVGTPIATFMSSKGQQSERYDAGGIGTPGAGTSHAAIFGGYVRDKEGNITGMNVVEQYSGSQPHTKFYPVGGGFGEKGAENYYSIRSAARRGAEYGPSGAFQGAQDPTAGPLDNDNWQQASVSRVQIHNKTGSDVHIAASTVMQSA